MSVRSLRLVLEVKMDGGETYEGASFPITPAAMSYIVAEEDARVFLALERAAGKHSREEPTEAEVDSMMIGELFFYLRQANIDAATGEDMPDILAVLYKRLRENMKLGFKATHGG